MPPTSSLARLFQRTRALPVALRYALTVVITLAVFAVRHLLEAEPAIGYPFGHLFIAILLCAALFDSGAGFVATAVAALLGIWFYLPPIGSLALPEPRERVVVVLFVLVGVAITVVVESLHRALAELQRTHEDLLRSERARALLLREFRHRTRNDLGSLVGLLMLRARIAPSDAAREALRDAAEHALALARVHARLALDEGLDRGADRAVVDTRDFVTGLCADIEAAAFGIGLRPVHLATEAEAHEISAERAVPLGLVVNETVTNALKYAFPEDRAGTVQVRFARQGAEFVLTVADDGIGLPPEGELEGAPPEAPARGAGLGTRLLRALAAQLRGRFARRAGAGGMGTIAELRFAVAEPGEVRPA
jgi:two-component sensor histidine kinase